MMKKYIIKNCPALTDQGECYQGSVFMGTAFKECQERSDCLLKQILKFVKWRDEESVCNSCGLGIPHRKEEFQRILNMLEIEEVDE